ncbi:MAG: DUF4406 domain-containing protein [Brevinematia bacterium]
MIVYMIHKFRLDPKNIEEAKKYIKEFLKKKVAVIYTPPMWFVEADVSEEEILQMCFELIDRCDVVAVCGEAESRGTIRELLYALEKGKPVKAFSKPDEIRRFL